MAKQARLMIVSLVFALSLESYECQPKLYNGFQASHGSVSFPSDMIRYVSSNHSPRRTSSMSSSKSGTQSQPTIVAIPLYVRKSSPSKAPILFDILSAPFAENLKSRKSADFKPKVNTHFPSKQISEIPKHHSSQLNTTPHRYQSQPQQAFKHSGFQKQEQLQKPDNNTEMGSTGHSTPQKQSTHSSSSYASTPQQSQSQSSQSSNKIIFPKSSVPQTLTQEERQKQTFNDFASALNAYGISKSDAQSLYDTTVSISQNSDSSSYNEKNAPKNGESSEYGSVSGSASSYPNINLGNRDPYSSSNGLSYSASSFSIPSYSIATNTGSSFGGRGSYINSGSGSSSYAPSYSSEGSTGNTDSVSNGNTVSLYNSAAIDSTGISEDNNYASAINGNYSPQSSNSYGSNSNFDSQSGSSAASGKSHRPYVQQTNSNSYALSVSDSGYGSGSSITNPNNDNYNNNNNQIISAGLSSLGYNTQAMTPTTSNIYNPNTQSLSSITFNPNYQSISSSIYNPNSQSITSSIYNPISQSISSSTYNPSSQLISPNNYNSNSQSLPSNSDSNGLYASSSNDYSSSEEEDCYDDKPSSSSDFTTSTTSTENEKSLTVSKSDVYTMPTQTNGFTSLDTEDIDPSKLDLKIVHLPVSLFRRLVGNGELALPSFHA